MKKCEMKEPQNRAPWSRMMFIHAAIKRGSYPNAVQIAQRLEYSVLTIKRDVAFMRDRMLLPLEYDARLHGYRYTRPVD